jgi:hypothetical protein
MWMLVGPVLCQWDVFTTMVIPMISLGGAYIIGDSWRPGTAPAPVPRPQSTPLPSYDPPYGVTEEDDEG